VRLAPLTVLRPRALHGIDRLIALLAVAVFGTAVLTVASPHTAAPTVATRSVSAATHRNAPAAPVLPAVRAEGDAVRAATRRVAVAERPATTKARPTHPRKRVIPFVPTGTGMWIYEWGRTNGGRAGSIVARARRVGLSTLFLRTGSSWDGFSGRAPLSHLLRATRGTSVRVVAWDFPRLRRPVHDALRLARTTRFGGAHGPHVAAVAPDIETPAEGTSNAAWRVRRYLHVLRQHLPEGVTILSTVPWPSSYRRGDYPYWAVAHGSDVLVPMTYWYNNPPGLVTSRSIGYLRRFHKPVQPVGQGYDGKIDVPSLPHNNLARQVPAFFRTAHRQGVRAVSIWSWQSARPATWQALEHAHRLFRPRR
jgi:hypothetical protein